VKWVRVTRPLSMTARRERRRHPQKTAKRHPRTGFTVAAFFPDGLPSVVGKHYTYID